MATQAPIRGLKPWAKTALRGTSFALGGLLAIILVFLLASWIGSAIPRNSEWEEPQTGIPIMIETNGIHTGIVIPILSSEKDWRTTFPSASKPKPDGRMPTHVAIGWGEKEVFLNTPTWGDLKVSTALRIVFAGGDGLLRVGHYANPGAGPNHRWITLRPAEYARLVEKVEVALPPLPPGEQRKLYKSFEVGAANYDATGRYTLANTCNQWVGDTLAYAGITMGQWTPLAGGVMKWIPEGD